jgi:hypothetical protein
LIVVSLITPIVTISYLSVGTVSAPVVNYEIVVRGKVTSYTQNFDPYPPQYLYQKGEDAVEMIAVRNIGDNHGGLIAAGFSSAFRNGRWNGSTNPDGQLDTLLIKAFEYINPALKKIAWLDSSVYNVYNTSESCSQLLVPLGTWSGTPVTALNGVITNDSLKPYDILIIPQMELGSSGTGGNQDLLDSSVIQALENFVENRGKILLYAEGNDTFGYNYSNVGNKILKPLYDNAGVTGYYFQSDSILDDDNYYGGNNYQPILNVDNDNTSIGAQYKATYGKATIGLYSVCSLAPKLDYDVGLVASPVENLEGLPGGTLVYTVTISNLGWNNDSYNLALSGNTWSATLAKTSFTIENSKSDSTTLTVTLGTQFGDNDQMTLTVTGVTGSESKSENINPKVGSRVYTTHDDAQVDDALHDNHFANYIWMWVCSTDTKYAVLTEDHKNLYVYLKFDLRGIPSTIAPGNWTKDNVNVRLYAYVWGLHLTVGENVLVYSVTDDTWTETTICWDNKPAVGTFQDNAYINTNLSWYSWDVTPFIRSQLSAAPGTDNFASFVLKAVKDNLSSDNKQDFAAEFYAKESSYPQYYSYLAVGYRVNSWITPDNAKGMRTGTVSYKVKIQNMGSFAENYLISIVENTKPNTPDNWRLTLSENKIELQPGKMGIVNLNVTIPSGASTNDSDNVLVRVVSEHNTAEKDNYYCITFVTDNRIGPGRDDTGAKSTLRLENMVWGNDQFEFGPEDTGYTALPGYNYPAAPSRGFIKFNLRAMGTTTVARATLNLYCLRIFGENKTIQGARVQVYSVPDNSWSEDNLTWKNMPQIGTLLDTRNVPYRNAWYSWDVTSYINTQRGIDNIASFCLVDLGENISDNVGATFYTKENRAGGSVYWPYLEIDSALPAHGVSVSINPIFKSGENNATSVIENYTVTVTNTGSSTDTYTLENEDNLGLGWALSLGSTSLGPISSGGSAQTTLYVTIPSGSLGTIDNIRVTATCVADSSVSDRAGCFAYRGKAYFTPLSIKPLSQASGLGSLYKMQVDENFLANSDLLVAGSSLLVRFRDYSKNIESENVFWSGGTAILVNFENVGHPAAGTTPVKNAVKIAELVLRTGTENRVLKSFTVIKMVLIRRIGEILAVWSSNPAVAEYGDILRQWSSAPESGGP